MRTRTAKDVIAIFDRNTKHQIARLLHKAGIKGYRSASHSCPIAKLAELATGRHASAHTRLYIHDVDPEGNHTHFDKVISLPHSAQQFIHDFDQGFYPELDITKS